MPLDRHQQVARLWDWLPAFRAAAEYESLQRASLAISVSASALSRSIKLLEDTLGVALFTRSPSGLALTPSGQRLLAATRDAMRRVHDAIPDPVPHRLRVGATAPALMRLLCEAAVDALPEWALAFVEVEPTDAGEALRCGDLDFVVTHAALETSAIRCEALPVMAFVLAVPPGGDATRVAVLAGEGVVTDPARTVTAANADQLFAVATRLAISAQLPAYGVPPDWTITEQRPSRPVFAVFRESADPVPPFIDPLRAALRARLAS